MALKALVYVSAASHPMTDADLRDILHKAREKNEARNVTGMLLYRDGFFIQALEGEQSAVDEIFDVIRHDDRHTSIIIVYQEPVQSRSFGHWSMGFNKISDADAEKVPGFTDFLDNPFSSSFLTANPSRAKRLLESFRDRNYF